MSPRTRPSARSSRTSRSRGRGSSTRRRGAKGPARSSSRDGVLESVVWLDGDEGAGIDDRGVVVAPGFIDLHAHLREPGNEDAETIASGLAAAAHGGFTTRLPHAEHDAGARRPGGPRPRPGGRRRVRLAGPGARLRRVSAGRARGDARGARRAGRRRRRRASPTTGRRSRPGRCSGTRSPTPGRSGCRSSTTPRTRRSPPAPRRTTASSRRCWACGAGPPRRRRRPSPATSRSSPTSSATCPGARLHLTHLSTAGALDLVRRAKAAGLPVTCDVTPHHLALTDEWLAGARRWAWEASGDPWADGALVAAPYATALRVNPPLRSRRRRGRVPGGPRRRDRGRDRDRPRAAHPGRQGRRVRAGVERDQRHRDGARASRSRRSTPGCSRSARAIEALTVGPARVLGARWGVGRAPGLVEGAPADLVVFDRSATMDGRRRRRCASRGKNSPLLGRELPGVGAADDRRRPRRLRGRRRRPPTRLRRRRDAPLRLRCAAMSPRRPPPA